MEFEVGNYVHANYANSRFTGRIAGIDNKHKEAQVVLSRGVDMIFPLSALTIIKEQDTDNEADS